jgi:hypothetical protein
MEIRQARAEEIPYLKSRLAETEGEQIDLDTARVWVAVENNRICGTLSLRLVWQAEPLLIFPEVTNKMTRRRAGLGMYRAMEKWLADPTQNRTGIRWFFAVTRSKAVQKWSKALGWYRQYRGAATFLKYL